jgi:hypothetical protein
MAIAAGATNLYFNRDTKVYLGQSAGKPVSIGSVAAATNAVTSATVHGISTGERVMFTTGLGTLSGVTAGVVYYAIAATTTTLKVATTLANAQAGTAITLTGTPASGYVTALDQYLTPTGVTLSGSAATITVLHNLQVGDVVDLSGVTDNASLDLNGVFTVASVSTTVSFTVATTASGTISNPGTIRISKQNLWEIPVLAGYSASSGTETAEVTLNEMSDAAGNSRRGRQMFNTAQSPSEWSFDTYVRPYKSTNQYCVEEPLWANLIARNYSLVTGTGAAATTTWASGVTRGTTDLVFDFNSSNSVVLGTFNLYYVMGANRAPNRDYVGGSDGGTTTIYKVSDAVVNECSITFEIDGISTVSWSGMGSALVELGSMYAVNAGTMGTTNSSNFIRNRLTALTAVSTLPTSTTYALTLTGGQITISNNISYLTPEVLGVVNKPIGHVTGTRNVSGNFSCYLDEIANGSIDLFQNLAQKGSTTVTNAFALNFYVGGGSANLPTAPGVQFNFPQAHLEIPSINFDDVISTEVNWHALPSTIGGTDEIAAIRYAGQPL